MPYHSPPPDRTPYPTKRREKNTTKNKPKQHQQNNKQAKSQQWLSGRAFFP